MAEPTRLVRDDAYEEMAIAYQCLQVATLDEALREHGIADEALRRNICLSFIFNMGNLHDQCWLEAVGARVFPMLCFTGRFLNLDTPIEDLGVVHAPSPMFAYHEYASGSVDGHFDGDPACRVETGPVGGLESV